MDCDKSTTGNKGAVFDLTVEDFAHLFGVTAESMPEECRSAIEKSNFRYTILQGTEREAIIQKILMELDKDLEFAGEHRRMRWEKGWNENLEDFVNAGMDVRKLIPKFVKPNRACRLQGNYIMPCDSNFESNMVEVLRYWLFKSYFEQVDHIYEFGCGTAHNLVSLASLFPDKMLHGLDWAQASVDIIKKLRESSGLKIDGSLFDMFKPHLGYHLTPNSGVLTIGTLEQLGRNFEPFLQYLLHEPMKICVHVETLYELYDTEKLIDYVAVKYLEKRRYLQGYLSRLKELQRRGIIKIMQVQRTFGSLYHDGYSFVVWKPLSQSDEAANGT